MQAMGLLLSVCSTRLDGWDPSMMDGWADEWIDTPVVDARTDELQIGGQEKQRIEASHQHH